MFGVGMAVFVTAALAVNGAGFGVQAVAALRTGRFWDVSCTWA